MDLKFLKRKKNFKKGNFQIRPDLYWHLALCVGVLFTFPFFIFGFYLFKQVNTEPELQAQNSNKQIEVAKKERVQNVLKYFSDREKKSTEILNSPSPIVDPSL